jgi:hypothetical protein
LLYPVVFRLCPNISEEHTASISRAEVRRVRNSHFSSEDGGSMFLQNAGVLSERLHSSTTQKTTIYIYKLRVFESMMLREMK